MGTILAGIAAIASIGSATYSITESERQKDKAERTQKQAKKLAEQKITERNEKISNMKTRLFSTDGGYFGDEADKSNIKGN